MVVFALVQAVEVCLGRIMLCADRQISNAAFVAVGAVLSLLLNLWWVPRFGVSGAIYAGAAAYFVIDVLCVASLRRAMTLAALLRVIGSLIVTVAAAAAAGALAARWDISAAVQAVAALAVFAGAGALAHRFRHSAGGAALAAPGGLP
jgi:O-antigen/teichoic acid export membrane protein